MLNNIYSNTSNDIASALAMIILGIMIILILYYVSKRRKKTYSKELPYKNKLFSLYEYGDGYILINHRSNDEKITFKSKDELLNYISKSKQDDLNN